MKKFYRITLLIIVLVFITTYYPFQLHLVSEDKVTFFNIKNIIIENNLLIEEEEVINKLEKVYNKNILFINSRDIKEPLKKINFLRKIEVKKKYPDTIIIKVFETKPVALLIKDKIKYLIDSSSNLILQNDYRERHTLPNVFGVGAEIEFISFFEKIKKENFPINKIKNFYYFQIGRWDVQLANSKVIKFPHNNLDEAIIKSIELLQDKDFKKYNIIDLRIDGKIIVE